MSRTTDLYCTQCNIGLWIGQSSFIYRGDDETMLALDIFLQVHRGHPLIFDFMEVTQNSRHAHATDIIHPKLKSSRLEMTSQEVEDYGEIAENLIGILP